MHTIWMNHRAHSHRNYFKFTLKQRRSQKVLNISRNSRLKQPKLRAKKEFFLKNVNCMHERVFVVHHHHHHALLGLALASLQLGMAFFISRDFRFWRVEQQKRKKKNGNIRWRRVKKKLWNFSPHFFFVHSLVGNEVDSISINASSWQLTFAEGVKHLVENLKE